MTTKSPHCQVCGTASLLTVQGYETLSRATSDSRPWPAGGTLAVCTRCGTIQKIPSPQWLEEIGRIYQNYEIYHQSAGSEQLIFSSQGTGEPRSKRLVDYVVHAANLSSGGKLLDIGCGNGASLRNFARALPDWQLYGCELSNVTIDDLSSIPNFVKLFCGAAATIEERFSLVSLIHTLEHLCSPQIELSAAARLLDQDGWLFVEVPDIENSPFDLLVADHLLHFTRDTLKFLASQCGIRVAALSNSVLSKEITLIGKFGHNKAGLPSPETGIALARQTVQWLRDTMDVFRETAKRGPVGVFGTAIAGMAVYGELKDNVRFFVDEDPNRIGRRYDDKPVLGLADAPKGVPVLLALPAIQADTVALRCRRAGVRAVAPPALRMAG